MYVSNWETIKEARTRVGKGEPREVAGKWMWQADQGEDTGLP